MTPDDTWWHLMTPRDRAITDLIKHYIIRVISYHSNIDPQTQRCYSIIAHSNCYQDESTPRFSVKAGLIATTPVRNLCDSAQVQIVPTVAWPSPGTQLLNRLPIIDEDLARFKTKHMICQSIIGHMTWYVDNIRYLTTRNTHTHTIHTHTRARAHDWRGGVGKLSGFYNDNNNSITRCQASARHWYNMLLAHHRA